MKIVVDRDSAGHDHFIDTDPTNYPKVGDPLNPSQLVDVVTMLVHISNRVDLQQKGGWMEINQLEGEAVPMTRWDRMIKAIRESSDTVTKEALGL